MIIILSFVIGFFLTVLRILYLPCLEAFQYIFDPNISLIIFAFLFGKKKDGYIVAIMLGIMTDNLSGAPFGMYLLSYTWTIIIIEAISLYLQKESILIVWAATSACILMQNYPLYFTESLFYGEIFAVILKQIGIALFLSPLLIFLIKSGLGCFINFNRSAKQKISAIRNDK